MPRLTIDYVLEGQRRGYTFTSGTDEVDAETLKVIWRNAMPRGQGWGDAAYHDARALKGFTLSNGWTVLCSITMTDLVDEVGRRGIRRAEIELLSAADAHTRLRERLRAIPSDIVAEAERKLSSRDWELLFRKQRDMKRPKTMLKPQTILAHAYAPARWRFVEACILLLVTRTTLLTNLIEVSPRLNPFADQLISFTTLALDYQDEMRIVALPQAAAARYPEAPIIRID